jgi:hypothetical protein
VTGLNFLPDPNPGDGNLQAQIGDQTFNLAQNGNLTELDDSNDTTMALNQVAEVQGHSSDIVGDIDVHNWGTVNFVEWNGYAGIDTRAAEDDLGDVTSNDWNISGDVEKVWLRDGSIFASSEAESHKVNIVIGGRLEELILHGRIEESDIEAGQGIGSIEIGGDLKNSSISTVRGIGNLEIHGQLDNSRIQTITGSIDHLVIDGKMNDSNIYAAIAIGNIDEIDIGNLSNSYIVGVKQGGIKEQGVEVAIQILDTNKKTVYPDQIDLVSVKGSKGVTARVVKVSSETGDHIAGVEVDGKGTLSFSSTSLDQLPLGIADDGSKIDIKSINASTMGYIVNLSGKVEKVTISGELSGIMAKGLIKTIEAGNVDNVVSTEGDIQTVKAGYIKNLSAGKGVKDIQANAGGIGCIRALIGDITKVVSDQDIESIWGGKNVKDVQATNGLIDSIYASGSVSIIRAKSLGNIFAKGDIKDISVTGNIDLLWGKNVNKIVVGDGGNIGDILADFDVKDLKVDGDIKGKVLANRDISKISVIGNIHLIEAMRDAKTISSKGNVEMIAHRDAVGIEGTGGIVYYGRKYSKISENLEVKPLE